MEEEINRRILFELLQDCRQPLSKLAKILRLPKQTVDYHIQKLENSGIIKKYTININYPKLGFSRHSIYLDLKTIDAKEVGEYLKAITDIKEISCCYMLHGVSEWKLYISIWTKTIARYDEIQTKIISKFKNHINNYTSFQSVKSYTYFARVLNPKKAAKCDIKGDPGAFELKDVDWRIIDVLRKDSRTSTIQLSNVLKIPLNTVSRRMKFLTANNIIERSYPILDLNKLGYREYTFISRINPSFNQNIEEFIKYAQSDVRFNIIIKAVGYVNLYYAFLVKNDEELNEIQSIIERFLGKATLKNYKIEVANMLS